MMVAPGKAAEAAARGKTPPQPNLSFFQSGLRTGAPQTRLEKREGIISCNIWSLRDFGFAGCHSHFGRTETSLAGSSRQWRRH